MFFAFILIASILSQDKVTFDMISLRGAMLNGFLAGTIHGYNQ